MNLAKTTGDGAAQQESGVVKSYGFNVTYKQHKEEGDDKEERKEPRENRRGGGVDFGKRRGGHK